MKVKRAFKNFAWIPASELKDSYSFAYWNQFRQASSFKLSREDILRLRDFVSQEDRKEEDIPTFVTEEGATATIHLNTLVNTWKTNTNRIAVDFCTEVRLRFPESLEPLWKKSGRFYFTEEAAVRLGRLVAPVCQVEPGELYWFDNQLAFALSDSTRTVNVLVMGDKRLELTVFCPLQPVKQLSSAKRNQ